MSNIPDWHNQIDELVDLLNDAIKAYDEGHPFMTDKEYDDLYFKLQEMEEKTGIILSNSPTVKVDYFSVNELKKVEHNHPMLSLDKTKSIDDVVKFCGNKRIIAMAKMDGLTCSLRYMDGHLVSAETRGNGIIGEDILHNIVFAYGVPLTIPEKSEVIVDGEIICTYKNFEKFNHMFANPRNFAAGSIRLLDNQECEKRGLSFVAWDCIKGLEKREFLSDKFIDLCQEWKFDPAPWLTLTADMIDKSHIEHAIILLKNWAKEESYPIDGIVFKYDDCNYYQSLGYTEHHFRGGLAYKFYDEIYETYLKDIEWSMGRTGVLTPVAVFEPVEIEGSIVERASMHNVSIMNKLLPHGGLASTGMTVGVYKANMIIPQIAYIKSTPGMMGMDIWHRPYTCPVCGGKVELVKNNDTENYVCTNPQCSGKLINQLDHFCGKKGMDIKGLSAATLEKLIEWGWVNSFIDLYFLDNYQKEWINKPGFGAKSVQNILDAIEKSKTNELWQFISAIGIPLIGSTVAKDICKHEFDWHNIREDIEGGFCFMEWDGFGPEMDKAIRTFDYRTADRFVDEIGQLKNSLWNADKPAFTPLQGWTFVITGKTEKYKNRDELKAAIEAHGGKVTGSVTKNTTYLVNNDINSTSSKNVTAKKLGVKIITEKDLDDLFDGKF